MNEVFPLFVGSGRSGTTLFRNVFDSHPRLAMTHEAHFIAPLAAQRRRYESGRGFDVDALVSDLYGNANFVRQGLAEPEVRAALEAASPATYPDAVRCVMAAYAAREGKPLYGDKTPGYVTQLDILGDLFPEARFVHIIRDGRDVALAYLDRSEWGPSTIADAAGSWRSGVGRGRTSGKRLGPHRYREVRYEDMVEDPETTTRSLCAFLSLDYDERMLRFHERGEAFIAGTKNPEAFTGLARPITKGMRNWRTEMSAGDAAVFETIAADLLESLGYDVTGVEAPPLLRAKAAGAGVSWQARRLGSRFTPLIRRARRTIVGSKDREAT